MTRRFAAEKSLKDVPITSSSIKTWPAKAIKLPAANIQDITVFAAGLKTTYMVKGLPERYTAIAPAPASRSSFLKTGMMITSDLAPPFPDSFCILS